MTKEKTTRCEMVDSKAKPYLLLSKGKKIKYKSKINLQNSDFEFLRKKKVKQNKTHIIVIIIATKSQVFESSIFVYTISLRYGHVTSF